MVELVQILKVILGSLGRWFCWGQEDAQKKAVKRVLVTDKRRFKGTLYAFLGCFIMQALGLGKVMKTVKQAGGGRPNNLFLRKPVDCSMRRILEIFGFTPLALTLRRSLRARSSLHVLLNLRRPWSSLLLGRGATWM